VNPIEQIYVLRVIATAGEGSTGIVGERHALIVLVREDSIEKAEQSAREALQENSWGFPEIEEISPLNPKLALSKTVEDAISDAAVHGFSLIVFNDPIPKH
jgi:hypothetical protein